jgi:hypothetical protein
MQSHVLHIVVFFVLSEDVLECCLFGDISRFFVCSQASPSLVSFPDGILWSMLALCVAFSSCIAQWFGGQVSSWDRVSLLLVVNPD